MVRQVTQAGALILIAALYAGNAAAHGRESMEEDSCVRRIGENMVHLSAYQPQFDTSAQYCTEIPKVGDTYLVVDLIDPAMREMPIGMRVIKGTNLDGRRNRLLRASELPSGRRHQGRDEPRSGTLHRHHHRRGVAALALPIPSAGADGQLRQHIPHRGRTAHRPAALEPAGIQTHEIQAHGALARPTPLIDNQKQIDNSKTDRRFFNSYRRF